MGESPMLRDRQELRAQVDGAVRIVASKDPEHPADLVGLTIASGTLLGILGERDALEVRAELMETRAKVATMALDDIASGVESPQCLVARPGEGTLECSVGARCAACRAARRVDELVAEIEWLRAGPLRCAGEWVSGSGGHRMFSADCQCWATVRDTWCDANVQFCDEHAKALEPDEREELPWAEFARKANDETTM